ncbi:MAG TPA: DUF559 domain-containing protein [Acidimicrobiales bacterium]|nr:DUF559 domain-containing protein [Acidimicrobiales bacterium]
MLPEGVVSHRSAAVLHGMMRAWAGPVEVTVAPGRLPRLTGAVPHQSVVLTEDRTEVDGIRVTSAARTIVDLAAALEPAWLERLLHEAVMRRQCAYADVAAVIDRTGGRGRPGTEDLRRMLGESVGDSALEVRWHRLLVKAGLRPPARQHQLVVDGRVYLLDFAWPDAQVALEVDGFAAHRTRAAFDRDRAKVLALQSAGWEVLSVSARTAPDLVIALLRRSISPFHRDSACGNAG